VRREKATKGSSNQQQKRREAMEFQNMKPNSKVKRFRSTAALAW
jgi:hypothetical protein